MIEAAAPAGTITLALSWLPPRKRGRRGSSEPPPTYAPAQPPGRGDGDQKRSRQVIDRLRLVLHRPGRQSSKGDRAAVCRCANGRERGRAGGSGRIGRGSDHHLFPARVRARPGGVQRIATSRTSHLLAARTPPPEALTAGFQRALLVSALCLAAAGAIALRASNTRGEPAATPEP